MSYAVLNSKLIINDEFKWMWKEAVMANFRYYISIPGITKKYHKRTSA
jgi:hypothetical protein